MDLSTLDGHAIADIARTLKTCITLITSVRSKLQQIKAILRDDVGPNLDSYLDTLLFGNQEETAKLGFAHVEVLVGEVQDEINQLKSSLPENLYDEIYEALNLVTSGFKRNDMEAPLNESACRNLQEAIDPLDTKLSAIWQNIKTFYIYDLEPAYKDWKFKQ